MTLNRLTIGAKLGLAIGVVVVLMLLLGVMALRQMAAINDSSESLANDMLPSIKTIDDVQGTTNDIRRGELQWVLAREDKDRGNEAQRIVAGRKRLAELAARYEALPRSPEEDRLYVDAKARLAAYLDTNTELMKQARAADGNVEAARAFLTGASRVAYRAMSASFDKLTAFNDQASSEVRASAEQTYAAARNSVITLLICSTLVALLFTLWIGRLISRPITHAVALTTKVANGELTQRFDAKGSDEPAQLMRALAHMQDQFRNAVSKVRDNAESVSVASAQIATGNADLSHRTEKQAASLQQSASAMEELSSTVRLNSDNARQADVLARTASDVATEGGRAVNEVVGTMKRIDESSHKIAEIISVIDGIAFQTNILALNAAVEAARAGEQGRGFAVVASEVRSLAQRSATAAKEIKQLISDSVERVGAGTQQVDRARVTMEQVVSSINRVCGVVAEISNATAEQSTGIAEVGKAVAQMDQATQQNSALVEESAAAAASLKTQAAELVAAVSVFRLSAPA